MRLMQADQAQTANVSELVTRARQGDREAFDGLVEIYASCIYSLALRITGDRDEAEDCVQEAFVRAFSGLRSFRGEAAFSTWLYRVTLNVANDAARRRARRPLSASELADADSPDTPDLDRMAQPQETRRNDPEESVLEGQRRQVLLSAIRSLPEHQRTVVALYDLHGLSYSEIARITRARVGTVKSRLNRGRLALKELLAEHMELLRG
jgi:RNA polymerase sigma-70 factor (ECF subfamily)